MAAQFRRRFVGNSDLAVLSFEEGLEAFIAFGISVGGLVDRQLSAAEETIYVVVSGASSASLAEISPAEPVVP